MTLDELDRLEKVATEGPFEHDIDRRHGGADQIVECTSGLYLTIVFGTSDGNENDLPLLVAARNALPKLLAVARAAEALRELEVKASKDVLNPDLSGEEVNAVYTKCIVAGEALDAALEALEAPTATDAAGALREEAKRGE